MIPELSKIEATDIPGTQEMSLKIFLKSKNKGVYQVAIDGNKYFVFFDEEGEEKIVKAKSEWGQKELELKECEKFGTEYLERGETA